MATGELIFLDTVDTTDVTGEEESDEEEFILQLDITHAVQAWLEDPASNLGVKVIFTGVTEPPPMSSEPELATETRFLKRGVRTKRSAGDQSIITGPSDCPASQPTTPPINWSPSNKKRNTEKCCRYSTSILNVASLTFTVTYYLAERECEWSCMTSRGSGSSISLSSLTPRSARAGVPRATIR